MRWLIVVMMLGVSPALVQAQDARRPTPERSSEPNYGTRENPATGTGPGGQEIRPGNRDGDAPSASAGRIERDPVERRIFGLPVNAVLVIAAVLLGLVALGFAVPARRRSRGRRASPHP